jgi:septum formation inhibitor MinC
VRLGTYRECAGHAQTISAQALVQTAPTRAGQQLCDHGCDLVLVDLAGRHWSLSISFS